MTRALIEAEAYLTDALNRWPHAHANLYGTRTSSSAGLLDGSAQGGYPTGHSGSARMECECYLDGRHAQKACRRCGLNEDDVRRAQREIGRELLAVIRMCCELLDVEVVG